MIGTLVSILTNICKGGVTMCSDKKYRVMNFNMTDKMHAEIRKLSYEMNVSMGKVIRNAVEEYIKKMEEK